MASLFLAISAAPAAVLYVDLNSANPAPPYTNWMTAATNIQDAVDAAVAGDEVLVTNGVYQTGGKAVFGTMTNRVAVDKAVAVQSVNGAEFTIIRGYQVPITTNGDAAIRCVYLTNGASLSGFTLTNGATRMTGDFVREQDGGGLWSETVAEVVSNCVIAGNSAYNIAGGSVRGMLNFCILQNNTAYRGGASAAGLLNNCTLAGNRAEIAAGAASGGMLTNCTLIGNSANLGGAAFGATLVNCVLTNNAAIGQDSAGGAAAGGTLINCLLAGNSADSGGGSSGGTLRNCLLKEKSARQGGGVSGGTLTNCSLQANWVFDSATSSAGGGAFQATLSHCNLSTNSASGLVAGFGGGAYGCILNYCTLTGNGVSGTNASGGGAYYGALTNCTLTGNRADVSGYVSGGDGGGGGAFWAELYHCALSSNLTTGIVGNGGGAYGGTLIDCTLTGNSVGGYFGSWGNGGGAYYATLINCTLGYNSAGGAGGGAYISTLSRCTLTANKAYYGGGADSSTLNGCKLISNVAASSGGGASSGTLVNCLVVSNSGGFFSDGIGGGAAGCALTNCTLTGNSAGLGGGISSGTVRNCIIYGNRTSPGPSQYDEYYGVPYGEHCCSSAAVFGPNSITNAPLFVDPAAGNFRLQANSPCIDAGENIFGIPNTDLDGRPRGQGGALDIGAYEFQPGVSGAFIGWLSQFGLPTDGSADYADSDNDRLNNWQEWIAGTVPTDAASVLRMFNPTTDASGVTVSWQSVSNRTYFLERASDLGAQPPFSQVASNIVGQAGTTSLTDTNTVVPGPYFYRVGVP